MRTSCCHGPYPPPTCNQPSLIPVKPPQVSLVKNEGRWRRRVASYCIIIGIEMCNLTTGLEAVAMPIDEEVSNNLFVSVGGSTKWSEKRTCQPWQAHSLETIVPENLPRPSARRRYEAVRSTSKTAPPLSVSVNTGNSCFSM